ncbi:MAG: hypothetical protein CMN57_00455 [Gammaproteobacteria bacterium]|nr:hypothetical protein [Gammaproteobacteria bacterium]
MRKEIAIDCDERIQALLLQALENYIDVAFPPHSSDCAQVARSALQDAVAGLRTEFASQGHARYNKRLRAMFREGIKLHYQLQEADSGRSHAAERELLLAVVGGEPAGAAELERARRQDTGPTA